MYAKKTMETQYGRNIFNDEKHILHVINMVKEEETKNIVVAAYHCPNNNSAQRWEDLISYIKKIE